MTLIGVTQRVTVAPATGEKRDSLAQDWRRFFSALGLAWVALPNHAEDALGLARALNVGGIVLTGGDDIGMFPERDSTELALLHWAHSQQVPVAGICRGFQLMQYWLAGTLSASEASLHRVAYHAVHFADGSSRVVNSFHNHAPAHVPHPLTALAWCPADGGMEAAQGENLLGILWHPEREAIPHMADLHLLYRHLTGKEMHI